MLKIRFRDSKGIVINILIISILWYTEILAFLVEGLSWLLLLLGILLVVTVAFDSLSHKGDMRQIPVAIWLIFFYLILSILFCSINSPNLSGHINRGITSMMYLFVLFSIVYLGNTRNEIHAILWNVFIMCIIVCVSFISNPQLAVEGTNYIRYSFIGMNPNGLAFLLTIGQWCGLYFVSANKIRILPSLIVSAILLYGIFLTGSKTGILASLFTIFLWFITCYFIDRETLKARVFFKRMLIFLLLVVVAYSFIWPILVNTSAFNRLLTLTTDASGTIRVNMYQKGFEFFKEHPVFGYGFNGFNHLYGLYSHSTIIEVFVSSGIVIGLLYFSSYYSIWKSIKAVIKNANNSVDAYDNIQIIARIKAIRILLIIMFITTVSVIHIYDFMSYYVFGIIIALSTIENNIVKRKPAMKSQADF